MKSDAGAAMWSSIELNTGIICICLPTLKPVVNLFLPRLLRTMNSGRSDGSTTLADGLQYPAGDYYNLPEMPKKALTRRNVHPPNATFDYA